MSCIVSMMKDAAIGHIYYEGSLSVRKIKDAEKVIRHHPFGNGIGTDIVFDISVHESTAGSIEIPKYRISFGIPSSAILTYLVIAMPIF